MLRYSPALLVMLACAAPVAPAHAQPSGEERSLQELRNTVINLLDALVEQGVMTRDKATALVRDAQERAGAEAGAAARADEGAVRVPYVPEFVREEIGRRVASDVQPQVVEQVLERARAERWGIPGALPEWTSRLTWHGDLRVRADVRFYDDDNAPNYLEFQVVNERGGIGRAGLDAFANVTEDRERLLARLRFGLDAELGGNLTAGFRLATGNFVNPVSTNQTLGDGSGRFRLGVEQVWLRWQPGQAGDLPWLTLQGGRMPSPWLASEIVYDPDLVFDGIYSSFRAGRGGDGQLGRFGFLTLGAFPLQEVERSSDDKWLLGAQLGADWSFADAHRLRVAAAYYDFRNVEGRRNGLESSLFDFTAPRFLQRGNTLFDIRNDLDVNTNLFALASAYQLATVTVAYELPLFERQRFLFLAEGVRNLGWDAADVASRAGIEVPERTDGYFASIGFGHRSLERLGDWRASFSYRYVQRDAVLDAFTDSDFRAGGTDVKGYVISGEMALTPRSFVRTRWLSGDAIDGPRFRLDTLQIDMNAQF